MHLFRHVRSSSCARPHGTHTRMYVHTRACVYMHMEAGHLPTLRLIQALSLRRHPARGADVSGLGITAGTHMMTNMAAGGRVHAATPSAAPCAPSRPPSCTPSRPPARALLLVPPSLCYVVWIRSAPCARVRTPLCPHAFFSWAFAH